MYFLLYTYLLYETQTYVLPPTSNSFAEQLKLHVKEAIKSQTIMFCEHFQTNTKISPSLVKSARFRVCGSSWVGRRDNGMDTVGQNRKKSMTEMG